jgi:hypothetical protein
LTRHQNLTNELTYHYLKAWKRWRVFSVSAPALKISAIKHSALFTDNCVVVAVLRAKEKKESLMWCLCKSKMKSKAVLDTPRDFPRLQKKRRLKKPCFFRGTPRRIKRKSLRLLQVSFPQAPLSSRSWSLNRVQVGLSCYMLSAKKPFS